MKYKTVTVVVSLLLSSVLVITGAKLLSAPHERREGELKAVTSFYPVYIAAMNLTEGTDITLQNLTEPTGGCLHDFQLRPQDMVTLENADLFLINGGGMETFMQEVTGNYPELTVVDSSEGIPLLSSEEHAHDHGAEPEEDEEYNAHIWISPTRYMQQLNNISNALCAASPKNAERIQENTQKYLAKISQLKDEMAAALANAAQRDIILFHDSFAYFADEYGLNPVKTINIEADTALSAGDIAEIIDQIKATGVQVLFAEEQYSTQLADAISRETDAKLYILDTCVRGEYRPDAYLEAMRHNFAVLQQALF